MLATVQTRLIFVAVAAVVKEGLAAGYNVALLGIDETSKGVAPCTNVLLQSSENCVRESPIPKANSGLPW